MEHAASDGTVPRMAAGPLPPVPPPPPPPPGQSGGWPPGSSGWLPAVPPTGPRIDLVSVIGRTFDTYGREWSLFMVLALPAAIGGVLSVALVPESMWRFPPPGSASLPTWSFAPAEAFALIGLSLLTSLASTFAGLAMMIAADRLWRGEPAGLGDSFGGAVRALPRVIGLWLLVILAMLGLVLLVVLPLALLIVVLPVVGFLLLLVLVVAFMVGALVVEARLSLLLPVLLFEHQGIVRTVTRTWQLTRGNAIMLLVTLIAIGVIATLSVLGASMIVLSTVSRPLAAIATGLGTVVTAPLGAIWAAIAWGDLVGGRHADSPVMARGRGRLTSLSILAGLGLVLFVAGSIAYSTAPPTLGY